jgi:hypothetical protein
MVHRGVALDNLMIYFLAEVVFLLVLSDILERFGQVLQDQPSKRRVG